MSPRLHLRSGEAGRGPYALEVTPETAGWGYSSLRVLELEAGGSHRLQTGDEELVVLPLAGACVVDCDGERFGLHGRRDVFSGVSDMAYVPRDASVEIASDDGGRFALAGARCERRLPPRYRAAEDVPVEVRGAGTSSRQVNNFCSADSFEADRLIAVEVLTPSGNWSSYPPHKHDEDRPGEESVLEEIYYFEVQAGPSGPGIAYHRVYGTADRPIDVLAEVRDRDVVLVPHGWHGPSVAAPGYHLYYLNVMAGPGSERAWQICDDPAHAWVRDTWAEQKPDPRLPLTSVGTKRGARPPQAGGPPDEMVATTPEQPGSNNQSVWGHRPLAGDGRGGAVGESGSTVRLTVAQAVVRFLAQQRTERDGVEHRMFEGCWGIFGHGNVAGLGQALLEAELESPGAMPYHQARNEQAMVHASAAFARMRNRLATMACTASIGPGATNMVTGAALATINRLPVLLLPGDVFATRASSPVLQELEDPTGYDVSVNDVFRPVSRFFDRVWRPEQLPAALLGAMRVLADPVQTGAVTIALPQDVQAEAWDWPVDLFRERVWHVPRPVPEPAALARAVDAIRASRRPLVVAGGGVIYSEATDALRRFAEATGIPVAETQAGKGSLPYDHPLALGAVGSTGTTAANAVAREADLVIGVGTRYSDFTTASRTAFADPDVRFVNVNVALLDAVKQAGESLVADAREALVALRQALQGWSVDDAYRARAAELSAAWDETVERAYALGHGPLPAQSEVIGVVNKVSEPRDVVVCAAGSMPGDLHKLWRTRDPKGYHVEYGYSCMGYEIAGGLGIRMACPDRDVFVMVGDGSYLMMAQELVTAVQEKVKIVVVLVQNHGFASIGALSDEVGSQRFGTWYRYRNPETGRLDGDVLPVDLAANAASLGVRVLRANGVQELRSALLQAKQADGPVLVHVETDPLVPAPGSESWWDVPVAEVAALETTRQARTTYEHHKADQRLFL